MTHSRIALLIAALALVATGLAAQRVRGVTQEKKRTAETAAVAVQRFLSDVRGGRDKAALKSGEEVLAHKELVVPKLLEKLEERPPREIVWILRALASLQCAEAGSVVVRLCGHASPEIRADAVVAGCRILGAAMEPHLLRAVTDEKSQVRRRAFDGVLNLPAKSKTAFVSAAFDGVLDEDFWIRSRGLRILASVPRPERKDPVLNGAFAVAATLPKDAAMPLFRIIARRDPKGVAELIDFAVGKGSVHAQIAALAVAGDLKIREHAGSAARLISSRDAALAKAATEYIGKCRDRKSVPMLVDLLATMRDKGRRETIAVALRQITGRPFGYDVDRWRAWMDEQGI